MQAAHRLAAEFIDSLTLEPGPNDAFIAPGSAGSARPRIFGGMIVAQALAAAYATVKDRSCHSLHAYFMRSGNTADPLTFRVERLRDGGSFTMRRVSALQGDREIFLMMTSFHLPDHGPTRQHAMPQNLPAPETLPPRDTMRSMHLAAVPEALAARYLEQSPVEIREIDPFDPRRPAALPDNSGIWFRLPARDAVPEHRLIDCILAYVSDLHLAGSMLRPLGHHWSTGNVISLSLDHAVWFHGRSDLRNWHLYVIDSPWTGSARGMNRGSIFTREGQLICTVVQEALHRKQPRSPRT